MIAGERLPVGTSYATLLPAMDFETYSEAGYRFNETTNKWQSIVTSPPHGLGAVGASAYSEHPSTEILSLTYDLKDGLGARLWIPGMDPPQELFDHFARGGLFEAWNSSFEWYIWNNVCAARMGWPALPFNLLRDAMAKAHAHSLPGKLGNATKALNTTHQKMGDGTRLLNKFSKPRNPTKKDPRRRIRLEDDPDDAARLFAYNLGDINAESEVSMRTPDLSPHELRVWLLDQTINFRGAAVDSHALDACTSIVDQAFERYTVELRTLTGGTVNSIGEIQKLSGWLGAHGVVLDSLDKEHISEILKRKDLSPIARRALEIRQTMGSASVKKLYAIANRVSADGRMRDLFAYCGAQRTGRFAGRGAQFQNLPKSGPKVRRCVCKRHCGKDLSVCPWCGARLYDTPLAEWSLNVVQDVLEVVKLRDLATVERYFGEAIPVIVGCLRALFIAPDGYELISSDYSAIEAVIAAVLSGEEWRLEVFRTHGMIYEASASMITGVPFEEFVRYKEEHGEHHPLRNKIGKYAELASGFGGWLGAWKAFGADKYLTDDEIKDAASKWRAASPKIVDFWKQLETAAISAISNPGKCFSPESFPGISYGVRDDILYCQLPSDRKLTYHQPRLFPGEKPWGKRYTIITYMGWNSDPKKGPLGWVRLETYGGKLFENVVQALARDIQVNGMENVERTGYPLVLHLHDESISQVRLGFGSIEEYERLLSTLPAWAAGWPIRASGGWRGRNYRKG